MDCEWGSHDADRQAGQACDLTGQDVAHLHSVHAGGRARENQIARLQLPSGREVLDDLTDAPDQLADVAALSIASVDL